MASSAETLVQILAFGIALSLIPHRVFVLPIRVTLVLVICIYHGSVYDGLVSLSGLSYTQLSRSVLAGIFYAVSVSVPAYAFFAFGGWLTGLLGARGRDPHPGVQTIIILLFLSIFSQSPLLPLLIHHAALPLEGVQGQLGQEIILNAASSSLSIALLLVAPFLVISILADLIILVVSRYFDISRLHLALRIPVLLLILSASIYPIKARTENAMRETRDTLHTLPNTGVVR